MEYPILVATLFVIVMVMSIAYAVIFNIRNPRL